MHSPHNRMVDASRFAMVPRNDVPRSAFDVQFTHKTTFDSGYLIPVYVDEVLPGDSFTVKMTALARLSTPLVPVMDNMVLESFFFFVPNRLLWDNWQRFMGEQASPTDLTTFLVPQIVCDAGATGPNSISDYFGITVNNSANSVSVSCLPFRAYAQVWNEWFRDQDLQTKQVETTDDGPDDFGTEQYAILRRGKRHDYFTSSRPFAAKPLAIEQVPGVLTPLIYGQSFTHPVSASGNVGAPVSGIGWDPAAAAPGGSQAARETGTRSSTFTQHQRTSVTEFYMRASDANFPEVRVFIHDLRTALAMQSHLEKNARGGSRYTEIVRSHFGVVSPDARMQRPEYLGGGRTMISVNPVAQTSATGVAGTTTVLGELAAVGSAVAHNHGFSQSFTEHGVILGLVSVRADLTYQQGVNRMWFRRTQFDFYWPSLAHLSEQAIYSKEIYCDGSAGDTNVWGFQERWSEYKYKPSRTSGYMRSSNPTPLDMWHLGQHFTARPALNAAFIVEDPPIDRVAQVNINEGMQFLLDAFFNIRMVRPMPMFSIPGLGPRL